MADERPILIDMIDFPGPCNLCATHIEGRCHKCGGAFDSHLPHIMGGSGYQSPKPSHLHLEYVDGLPGRRAYWDELCLVCYKEAYKRTYGFVPPELEGTREAALASEAGALL